MNTSAELYFIDGCGRCALGGTDDCKVRKWHDELKYLRQIIQACGLKEECKWGSPCYTLDGKNILMLCAFKNYSCISFFKGVLLKDENELLEKPGPHSQSSRLLKFTTVEQIKNVESEIKAYIFESIENEKAGLKVKFNKKVESIPEELAIAFEDDPLLKSAFETLTPGRQRGYLLHFSQPKKSETRTARINKSIPYILAGIGFHDQYKMKK